MKEYKVRTNNEDGYTVVKANSEDAALRKYILDFAEAFMSLNTPKTHFNIGANYTFVHYGFDNKGNEFYKKYKFTIVE